MASSVESAYSVYSGVTPQNRLQRLAVAGSGVTATIGIWGRHLEAMRAVDPDCVKAMIAVARISSAVRAAERLTASAISIVSSGDCRRVRRCRPVLNCSCSAALHMRRIIATVSTGYLPIAVSADSITASVPSKIALATSEASARVGLGLSRIESSIWVAVITGVRVSEHRRMIRFCHTGTSSGATSTPKSPRATMSASATLTISGRCSSASGFSIFPIRGTKRPHCSQACRKSIKSSGARRKESAT